MKDGAQAADMLLTEIGNQNLLGDFDDDELENELKELDNSE
jgi:hypothetical protein